MIRVPLNTGLPIIPLGLTHPLLRASATLREIIRSCHLSGVPIRPGDEDVTQHNRQNRLTADIADFTDNSSSHRPGLIRIRVIREIRGYSLLRYATHNPHPTSAEFFDNLHTSCPSVHDLFGVIPVTPPASAPAFLPRNQRHQHDIRSAKPWTMDALKHQHTTTDIAA